MVNSWLIRSPQARSNWGCKGTAFLEKKFLTKALEFFNELRVRQLSRSTHNQASANIPPTTSSRCASKLPGI